MVRAGSLAAAVPPDADLAVLAEVQGLLTEVLGARNCELSAQVASLEERPARVECLVSRNSGNSSMPPSADDLPGDWPGPGQQPWLPGHPQAAWSACRWCSRWW